MMGLKGKAMEPTINIITLGVKNIESSKQFYEQLGFKTSSATNEHIVVFKTKGVVLCLYPADLLAKDAGVNPKQSTFHGITLAYNVAKKEDVAPILAHAASAGGKIIKEAQDVFWGGHSGYFADPDGHLWEVAWNPHWPLVDGMSQVPD